MKAVNSNTQTMLAKLLAKENINVVVGNYNTAFFDIKNRTLGLPTWNSDNKGVSDLLVGHEVGHALYTPSDAVDRFKKCIPGAPFDIANIVEDIRIERLVRANYPGLIYSFNEGYKYFIENDFFKIKSLIVGDLKFIDRLNLRGKIGALVQVPMSKNEEAIYSRCLSAETYDDVLDVCKDIYDLIKNENDQQKNQQQKEQKQSASEEVEEKQVPSPKTDDEEKPGDSKNDQDNKGSSDSEKQEASENDFENKAQEQDDGQDDEQGEDGRASSNEENEEEFDSGKLQDQLTPKQLDAMHSSTQNQFDSNLQKFQKQIDYRIANAPTKEECLDCVVTIDKIMSARQTCATYESAMNDPEFVKDFTEFKSKMKKHIAVLIKEFERRKSAFQYSRSRQSDSGSINVNKLHSYKFEDQIFKSVTTLADAKSHGMVFFIDYSGSMLNTLEDVIDQTLQLVYFCKAVGIPFEVYGFTGPEHRMIDHKSKHQKIGLHIDLRSSTHVFELLNSTMKKDKFELSVRELKAQLFNFQKNYSRDFNMNTMYEKMSSTPLLQTIIIAHEIVKNFKIKNRVQKMNTIFLTDGEGPKLSLNDFSNDVEREHRKPILGRFAAANLRDSNLEMNIHGRTVTFDNNSRQMYRDLIANLKITCDTTVLGFFIGQYQKDFKTTGINSLMYNTNIKNKVTWNEAVELFKNASKKIRKEKCVLIPGGFGYDAYFIFDGSRGLNIDDNDTFESETVKEGKSFNDSSSQNKLAREFTKFTSEKRTSRVFLNKFAELIA